MENSGISWRKLRALQGRNDRKAGKPEGRKRTRKENHGDTKRKKGIRRKKNTERREPRINANKREFFGIRSRHEISI